MIPMRDQAGIPRRARSIVDEEGGVSRHVLPIPRSRQFEEESGTSITADREGTEGILEVEQRRFILGGERRRRRWGGNVGRVEGDAEGYRQSVHHTQDVG